MICKVCGGPEYLHAPWCAGALTLDDHTVISWEVVGPAVPNKAKVKPPPRNHTVDGYSRCYVCSVTRRDDLEGKVPLCRDCRKVVATLDRKRGEA